MASLPNHCGLCINVSPYMTGPIPVLTGPTAVGKTALSMRLARALDAEIISADSRQIYKGLDIGTAKPPMEFLESVRHHFVDELELTEPYSAGQFQEDARQRIAQIRDRGMAVLVVGGSTLYLHALKHGLADIPPVPGAVRRAVEQRLKQEGSEALYRELRRVDPDAARTMDATKTQRLVRALEVYQATGRPLTSFHANTLPSPFEFKTFVLDRERALLYERINWRVDAMLEEGLLDEVRSLLSAGYSRTLNPLRTIGYQEPIRFLDGEITYDEMVRLIKRNSRRYAKRQLTWFRRAEDNVWLSAERKEDDLLSDIRSRL